MQLVSTVSNMALKLEHIQNINEIAFHIFALLDFKTLCNLEQINKKWSNCFKDSKLWLRLCIKKDSKWFKKPSDHSNQNFVQYKNANLQWYQLLEIIHDSENLGLKKSIVMYLKLRLKTSLNLQVAPIYKNIAPFTFAARWGDVGLAKCIVSRIDPFKKMKRSANIDVEQGEVLDNEVVPFDPTLIPIHIATKFGHLEVVTFLMETYSHLNDSMDEENKTPIEHAINQKYTKLVRFLLRFPMRNHVKTNAFSLAIEKNSYWIAFTISKIEFLEFFHAKLNPILNVVLGLLLIFAIQVGIRYLIESIVGC